MVYALLIKGENGSLKYLENDIKNIDQVLSKIGVNTLSVSGKKTLITEKLCEVQDQLSNGDTLIIYYTGHGYLEKNDVVLKLGLQSSSAYSLSVSELTSSVVRANVGNIVYIFDCCFASKAQDIWIRYGQKNQSVFVPSSELSRTQEFDKYESSFFTYCICSALDKSLDQCCTDEGTITIGRLYEVVKNNVIKFNAGNPDNQQPLPELYGVRSKDAVIGYGSSKKETDEYEKCFQEYLNNFKYCVENCEKLCVVDQIWCTSVMKADVNILKYVIPTVKEFVSSDTAKKYQKINLYYEKWFSESDNYVGLLGDVGVGKTTACAYLFYYLATKYEALHLVPVYLPLKKVAPMLETTNIYEIIKFFMGKKITLNEVEYLCKNRKAVFILDGFDEISSDSNITVILQNYEHLKPFMRFGCKTMLTCRTHYFSQQEDLEEVLTGRTMGTDFAAALLTDEYPYNIIELQKFDEDEILELISLLVPDKDNHQVWDEISEIYDLRDLARSAILLKMIIISLPQLQKENRKVVNSTTLYNIYTVKMLRREMKNRRLGMDLSEKERFMGYIAYLMFENDKLSISTRDFDKEIKNYLSTSEYGIDEFNNRSYDCKVSSFFSRDMQDNYSFIHKSFYEYYFAKYCVTQISMDNDGPWKLRWFPKEIACFLKEILSMDENKHLIGKIVKISLEAKDGYLIWNTLHILSLLEESDVKQWLTESVQNEYIEKGEKETKCVIIRQYCRIIAKFIDRNRAERLIDKIIEIAKTSETENEDNDQTYYNYYGGKVPACNAFIKHLSVDEPKYDAKLHLYLLEHIATEDYIDRIREATERWGYSEKYKNAIDNAIQGIETRMIA